MGGKFLSFDGIDGCGKSTQIEKLASWLRSHGTDVLVVRDPGGTRLGELLRDILLNRKDVELDVRAEMLLYMASRAQLVAEVIQPALQESTTVIADRYLLANVVYQGCGGGLEPEDIWSVGEMATNGIMPDHTILLDLDPKVAQARLSGELDRLESRGLEYMSRVRDGFLLQGRRLAHGLRVVDASRSVETVHLSVLEAIGKPA